jgi:hypothetical protein
MRVTRPGSFWDLKQSRLSRRFSQNYEKAWWHRCPHLCVDSRGRLSHT